MEYINILYDIDFQNQSQWVMLFADLPNLTFYIEGINIPSYKFETNSETKAIIGFSFLEDIAITFKEDEHGTVQNFLGIWETLIWDRDTKIFRDNQNRALLDAVVTMDELSVDIPTLQWNLTGLKYKGKDTITLSYGSDEILKLTAQFSLKECKSINRANGYGQINY